MRHFYLGSKSRVVLAICATLVAATCGAGVGTGIAEETPESITLKEIPAIKQLQRDLYNSGERRRQRDMKAANERAIAKKKGKRVAAAQRSRPVPPSDIQPTAEQLRRHAELERANPPLTQAVPPNARHNNPAGDGTNAAQSEVSIAMLGQYGLSSWNDGQGFITPPAGQGVAYTTDGGATWVDVGLPPLAGSITDWFSDPVIAVNEKTGEFWFCSLTEHGPNDNGISVVRATFPGGVFTWDTPHVAQTLPYPAQLLDKQWIVADSSSGNLYLSYTHFGPSPSWIGFQRSTDGGVTWSPEIMVTPSAGNIQGSRPAVAGDGTLYVTWREVGSIDVDFVRVRRSVDQGVSFQPLNPGYSYYDNFGTGAPGFNRNRNVVEPCPVVDRSNGPYRGRLYSVVHEALNFFDDPFFAGSNKSEPTVSPSTEVNNNFFSRAVPFTIGQTLRGRLQPVTDLDYWSFPATQGSSYIFYCDSIGSGVSGFAVYDLRVRCGADTLTLLSFTGSSANNGSSLIVWTAPTTATYYLRIRHNSGGSATNGYRIRTTNAVNSGEVGRDQRDVVVHYSDDGGATWSSPVRVNDDVARYDNFLPEVGVTQDGHVYAAWYDWRDATTNCHGSSHLYVSRSVDGGATWAANQRVSSAPTAWTVSPTNIAPNEGDYIGLYAGDALALGWADCRTGEADVNVWGTTVAVDYTLDCPNDTTVSPNTVLSVNVGVTNLNQVFANTYAHATSIDHAWTVSGPGNVVVAENGGTNVIPVTVTIPDTATGTARVCVAVTLGGVTKECCFDVTVQGSAGVGDPVGAALAIRSLSPNPASGRFSVTFSLPHASPARLELIDVNGRRAASRDVGALGAGRHTVAFDHEIQALPAGVYAVKLIQNGRAVTGKVSLVR